MTWLISSRTCRVCNEAGRLSQYFISNLDRHCGVYFRRHLENALQEDIERSFRVRRVSWSAHQRSDSHYCKRSKSDTDGGSYIGAVCSTKVDDLLLRIYSTDGALLAK